MDKKHVQGGGGMSVYRHDDPRELIWQMLEAIQKQIKQLEMIIDEAYVDLDDGKDWITQEMERDE